MPIYIYIYIYIVVQFVPKRILCYISAPMFRIENKISILWARGFFNVIGNKM